MLILALDTTTRAGSAAVLRDDDVLSIVVGDETRTHGERLPGEIAQALQQAGITARALDLLVVATGPGAFTGLRIGLAAVQGLAMVLNRPVAGVSALDATADAVRDRLPAGERRLAVWMDAQRGEVFDGRYDAGAAGDWSLIDEPGVGPPAAALARLPRTWQSGAAFVGDGVDRYRDLVRAWSANARVLERPPALAPSLARLGRRQAERGAAGPPHALQPLYVRRPDAELERARRTPPV